MKYTIAYSAAGLPVGERSLPPAMVEHHAACLESDLAREHSLEDYRLTIETRLKGLATEVDVEFLDVSDSQVQVAALAQALANVNSRASGLCFVF